MLKAAVFVIVEVGARKFKVTPAFALTDVFKVTTLPATFVTIAFVPPTITVCPTKGAFPVTTVTVI